MNEPVIVAMATFPPRKDGMLRVVHDLLPQCDRMLIYMNGYDERPPELPDSPKLEVILAGPRTGNPDKGCQGKLHWVGQDPGYYLTVDDDILYPVGYARYMVQAVDLYRRRAFVGLHGGLFQIPGRLGAFPTDKPHTAFRRIYGYSTGMMSDTVVHTLGGGVMACYPQALNLDRSVCGGPPNSGDDEDIAIWAQKNSVPMIRLAGKNKWVMPNNTEWIKQPLHKNPDFLTKADSKIKSWKNWRLVQPQQPSRVRA